MRMLEYTFAVRKSLLDEECLIKQTAYILLFKNIQNSEMLKNKIMNGKFMGSFIRPNMILDLVQLKIATHNALRAQHLSAMSTKSIYSEIIYRLSGSRKIGNALENFGMQAGDTNLIVVALDADHAAQICKEVEGEEIDAEKNLGSLTNMADIKWVYKLSSDTSDPNDLLPLVLCCMTMSQ